MPGGLLPLDSSSEDEDEMYPPLSPTTMGPTSDLSSPIQYPHTSSPTSAFFQTSPATTPPDSPISPAHPNGTAEESNATLSTNTQSVTTALGDAAVVWGTALRVAPLVSAFGSFLDRCRAEGPLQGSLGTEGMDDSSGLADVIAQSSLSLNTALLREWNPSLEKHLLRFPAAVLPLWADVLRDRMAQWRSEESHGNDGNDDLASLTGDDEWQVRPWNLAEVWPLRALGPANVEELVSVRGMVIRVSAVLPELRAGLFRCSVCRHEEEVTVGATGNLSTPGRCGKCGARGAMELQHNRSRFADRQAVRLQEPPESVPAGATPQTVTVWLRGALVDRPRPGDRVEITGIFRALPVRLRPGQRSVQAIYRTAVDALHLRRRRQSSHRSQTQADSFSHHVNAYENTDTIDMMALHADDDYNDTEAQEEETLPAELEAKLLALSRSPDIYEKLTRSLAPNIWELDDVKKGILCQLFGGTHKEYTEVGIGKFRGEINVLMCGDPGTSKSQLLQYVHKIAPRGIYTSGKGSSAVGLTAYVTK